jgi:5-methyltetrahydropteroyltriglutamate--homocysteine methyltransferase
MKTTVVGPYPKISEDPTAPNLRSALNRRDAGKISDEELESVYRQTIARVIREQEEAGLDEISDGLIRWDDLCDPFARHWSGMSRGGLLRFFDNNTYYRQPIISGPVNHTPATVEDMVVARNYAHKPIKAVLPGPFTLAALSIDRYYGSQEKLVMALAEALHQEALALATAGAASSNWTSPRWLFTPTPYPWPARPSTPWYKASPSQRHSSSTLAT